jgi:hypothetical protein
MNRLLVGRVLSLGLLVVVVVLALSACGGEEKKAKARPLPEEPKTLRARRSSSPHSPSMSARDGQAHPWKRPTAWRSLGDRRRG